MDVNLDIFDLDCSLPDDCLAYEKGAGEELVTPSMNKFPNIPYSLYNNPHNPVSIPAAGNPNLKNGSLEGNNASHTNHSQYNLTQKDSDNLSSFSSYKFEYKPAEDWQAPEWCAPGQQKHLLSANQEPDNLSNIKIIDQESDSFGPQQLDFEPTQLPQNKNGMTQE